jgi:hypothetical protein
MRWQNPTTGRTGAIAPMTAIIMMVLITMVAFAVDMSWIVVTNMEPQNAADAAALAGSDELMENYVLYHMPNQSDTQKQYLLDQAMDNARHVAKEFAAANGAGGVASLTLLDQDIEFGFTDEDYKYTPLPLYTGYPNTVRVRIRRDNLANTPLNLFFAKEAESGGGSETLFASAPSFGSKRVELNRDAGASLNGGFLNNFNPNARALAVLPMVLDEVIWDAYLTKGVDPYGNETRLDDLGNPTLEIYAQYKDKGNFGQLSLNGEHTGASQTINWIDYGMQSVDVKSLIEKELLPVSADNMTWNWIGNPGFKASTVEEVNEFSSIVEVNNYSSDYEQKRYTGKVFLLPLFKAKDGSPTNYQPGVGQGSKYYYNIVRFVGVRIMPTQDTNREIVIQPAPVLDPEGYFRQTPTPVMPPTGSTPVVTTFSSSNLTR